MKNATAASSNYNNSAAATVHCVGVSCRRQLAVLAATVAAAAWKLLHVSVLLLVAVAVACAVVLVIVIVAAVQLFD